MATQIFLEFSSRKYGEDEPIVTSIFFRWVGSTTDWWDAPSWKRVGNIVILSLKLVAKAPENGWLEYDYVFPFGAKGRFSGDELLNIRIPVISWCIGKIVEAPSCLGPPCWSPFKGDWDPIFTHYIRCIWGWLLRVPSQGYHHFPYDWWKGMEIIKKKRDYEI